MQDVQNIPVPDVEPNSTEDDFGNHPKNYSDVPDEGDGRESVEDIPLPPDQQPAAPIEDPPKDDSEDTERIA